MVFSSEKWNDAAEMQPYIPVSAALSFEKVGSSLTDAYNLFVRALVGDAVAAKIDAVYASTERTASQEAILRTCQRAVANLAFWYNYTELQMRITDQGTQRQEAESGSFKTPYKYQEDALRDSFRNKGFNSLDKLLEQLEADTEEFPEYAESPAYIEHKSRIVKGISEVNAISCIYGSRLLFLRLKPYLATEEELYLQSVLGTRLYKALLEALSSGTDTIGKASVESLRKLCARVLVHRAVASLIRSTGSLTDRGLYFDTLMDGDGSISLPADSKQEATKATQEETLATRYESQLMEFVQEYLPEYYGCRPSQVLTRDNNGHKAFFA